jgi:hypothetical protein
MNEREQARMATNEGEETSYGLRFLSEFQNGLLFLFIASALIIYVVYQIDIGRVFTKSGDMPLVPGLAYGWLAIESFAAGVGIVRGIRMIRR